MKTFFIWAGSFVGIIVILFVLELVGLGFFKFFEPKRENIRREIFENTKSYTQGMEQDLAKYYYEWTKAETQENKTAIEGIIRLRFGEFDKAKLDSPELINFLTNVRGF